MQKKRRNYPELASLCLAAAGIILLIKPSLGIFAAILAVLVQVFSGSCFSRKAMTLGIIAILINSFFILAAFSGARLMRTSAATGAYSEQDGEMSSSKEIGGSVVPPATDQALAPRQFFTFDWGMVGVLMGLFTSAAGWFVSKKHRKETLKLISEIDDTYNANKENPQACMQRLQEIKERLKKEFELNKIEEANFQLLYKMTDRYCEEMKGKVQQP